MTQYQHIESDAPLSRRVNGADGRKPLPSGRFSGSGGQLLAGLGVRFFEGSSAARRSFLPECMS